MDSIHNLKGYDIVNPSEDQIVTSHRRKVNQKRRIAAVAIFLAVLLTLIVGALIGTFIHDHESSAESPASVSSNSADSLKAICSVTRYPDSCVSSISSAVADSNSPPKTDPEFVLSLSLRVAVEELANLSSLPKLLISKSNDPRSQSALRDCVGQFADALSQLNTSLSAMEVAPGGKLLTEKKIDDIKTSISGAMTYQDTCIDGLIEMESTLVDEIKAKVQNSKEYMSNSLAILANIGNLLKKFGLTMH